MQFRFIVCALLLSVPATTARAEVVESSANSMKIRQVMAVSASPQSAWQAFIGIGNWWSSGHTWSGDSKNLRLEPRAGGCFCETLPNGGSVLHMSVVYVAPGQRLTMTGALGPLQTAGVAGAMTFQVTAKGTGSEIALLYNVGGYYPGGLDSVASGVDAVLGEQFARLGRLIDTGSADEKKTEKK